MISLRRRQSARQTSPIQTSPIQLAPIQIAPIQIAMCLLLAGLSSQATFAQGGPPRPIRLVLLNANDPWIGWIGLIQYTDNPNRPRVRVPRVLGPGSHIIVAAVADAQKACDAAVTAPGVRMMSPPKISEYPPRTAGAPMIRVLGCQFFDADGAYLELNQTLP